jgi:polysaccharide pyruvyl transferase WcaK-like protein
MLHSTIFALANNTPFINLLYDEKNKAFLDLFELNNLGVDILDIESTDIESTIENSINNWRTNETTIFNKRMLLVNKQVEFVKVMSRDC